MIEDLELSHIDVLSFVVSAIVHDFKHPGQTNSYHINKQTDLALIYNDISILENYHISETFKVLNKPNCNIFTNFSKDETKLLRKRIVDMILATDMSYHTKLYTHMKLKIENLSIENGKNIDKIVKDLDSNISKFEAKQEVLNYLLHTADLSHNSKIFKITEKWTTLVMTEFWLQGDLEKESGLQISFNCDRAIANVPKGQIGFLNAFIMPTFHLVTQIFPTLGFFIDNVKQNIEQWNYLLSLQDENKI